MPLTAFLATAIVALPVLLLAVIIIEFYRMARMRSRNTPIPALLRRVKDFFLEDGRWALGLPLALHSPALYGALSPI